MAIHAIGATCLVQGDKAAAGCGKAGVKALYYQVRLAQAGLLKIAGQHAE
ncbi:hypothetical protein [Pseudomonas laurentiana]